MSDTINEGDATLAAAWMVIQFEPGAKEYKFLLEDPFACGMVCGDVRAKMDRNDSTLLHATNTLEKWHKQEYPSTIDIQFDIEQRIQVMQSCANRGGNSVYWEVANQLIAVRDLIRKLK